MIIRLIRQLLAYPNSTNPNSINKVNLLKSNGFTFVEMLTCMAILVITLLVAFQIIVSQKEAFKAEEKLVEMAQNSRASLDILLRDLRLSGFKALEEDFLNSLSGWIHQDYLPSSPTSVNLASGTCPIITQGSSTCPDMITMFMADIKECTLSASANSNATTLIIDPNSQGYTGAGKFRVDDIIRIGDHTEFARIVDISDEFSNILTIDTNPSVTGNQGLSDTQNAGQVIREINIITYTVFNEANDPSHLHHTLGHPVLKRKINEAAYVDLAEDVEDLQIIPQSPPNYKLQLITRTSEEGNYIKADSGLKKTDLTIDFRLRNYLENNCRVPAMPTITSVTGLNSGSPCNITINWSAVTSNSAGESLLEECLVTEYILTYDTTAGSKTYSAYPGLTTSYTIHISPINDSLAPTYYLSLAAVNCAGISSYATEQTIQDTYAPSGASFFSATGGENTITLNWSDSPECDLIEYHLYRGVQPGGPYTHLATIANQGVNDFSYQDANVTPCQTYVYIVKAFDQTFESTASSEVNAAAQDTNAPEPPTNFSFTIIGNQVILSFTLSIDDPQSGLEGDDDVTGYALYGLIGENEYLIYSSFTVGQTSANLPSSSYTDFSLKAFDLCDNYSSPARQITACPQPPVIAFSSHISDQTVQDTILIVGTVTSQTAISLVKLQIDGGAWQTLEGTNNWQYSWDTTTVDNSLHTVTIVAFDSEGCSALASLSLNVANEEVTQEDTTPPEFGSIVQTPGSAPVPADQSVDICVRITDESGIYSAIMAIYTNAVFSENITMTSSDPVDVYCANIPQHNGCNVNYTITAIDNSSNHNPNTVSSGYQQAQATPSDTTAPIISNITLQCTDAPRGDKTIQITVTITDDASGLHLPATFNYDRTSPAIHGGGNLTPIGSNRYQATYSRHQSHPCMVTITASDKASNTTVSSPVSDDVD